MEPSVLHQFRLTTKGLHDEVDHTFSRFDLSDLTQYGNFLEAHAMALLPVERTLSLDPRLPVWRTRGGALCSDLAALDLALPPLLSIPAPISHPQALGMLYVVEGSRLGGAVLSPKVAPSFPSAFLNSRHRPGEWRTLLDKLRTECAGRERLAEALSGAQTVFNYYLLAAECVLSRHNSN